MKKVKKVLVVDSDPIVRALVAAVLEDRRYQVIETEDVPAAHEAMSETRPDAVILEAKVLPELYSVSGQSVTSDPNGVAASGSQGGIVDGRASGVIEQSHRSIESIPVILLRAGDAESKADDALDSGSVSVRQGFSPLELIRDFEMVVGPLRLVAG